MPRTARVDIGREVYHILNRANARVQIFDNEKDYFDFEKILQEAVERFDMRLLAYCIMPNHWHLVVHPKQDKDLAKFMGWLTNTHTRRWHTTKKTTGQGHLYQGRYKSFLCQQDDHFITLVRYVERNAKKAGLCNMAQDWKWSSIWRRENGNKEQCKILSEWPVEMPSGYLELVNQEFDKKNIETERVIDATIEKGNPFGNSEWLKKIVKKFGLEQTLRKVGRPKKG